MIHVLEEMEGKKVEVLKDMPPTKETRKYSARFLSTRRALSALSCFHKS